MNRMGLYYRKYKMGFKDRKLDEKQYDGRKCMEIHKHISRK